MLHTHMGSRLLRNLSLAASLPVSRLCPPALVSLLLRPPPHLSRLTTAVLRFPPPPLRQMLSVLERKERIVEAEINILEYQEANRECYCTSRTGVANCAQHLPAGALVGDSMHVKPVLLAQHGLLECCEVSTMPA